MEIRDALRILRAPPDDTRVRAVLGVSAPVLASLSDPRFLPRADPQPTEWRGAMALLARERIEELRALAALDASAPTRPDEAPAEQGTRIQIQDASLARLLHWISAADAKVSTVLAIDTAMLGVIAAITPAPADLTRLAGSLGTIASLLILYSLYCLFQASFPQTVGPKGSLIFFGGICQREEAAYVRTVCHLRLDAYEEDLAKQCYRNAEIAGRKFRFVKQAMAALLFAMLPWAAAVYVMYDSAATPFLS